MTKRVEPHSRPERPIVSESEDVFDRKEFVERLSNALVHDGKSTGVVIGLTGPWGSGKSSVLNLLSERIREKHSDAIIVRFDPWLISGRNDLIAEFFSELEKSIDENAAERTKFKNAVKSIADYGERLAPTIRYFSAAGGAIVEGAAKAAKAAVDHRPSLTSVRAKLSKSLIELGVPIVVLIDEMDRIEDTEVKAIAQLVRAAADFSNISYLLAFDVERVVEALGADAQSKRRDRNARGRAYLEKIVQIQIPLPMMMDEERSALIASELEPTLTSTLHLANFSDDERYSQLIQTLARDVITTPRDVKRMVGIFNILVGMVGREVDWVDLLAFSALQTKAPQTLENLRRAPEEFVENPLSMAAIARRLGTGKKTSHAERLAAMVDPSERDTARIRLVEFIFPENSSGNPDALSRRRPLLTVLRLGLPGGVVSRDEVQHFVRTPPHDMPSAVDQYIRDDRVGALIDRIDETYATLEGIDHVSFWRGLALAFRRQPRGWLQEPDVRIEATRTLANVLEGAVQRDTRMQAVAKSVFLDLNGSKDLVFVPQWLHTHTFEYGLFGSEKRSYGRSFLSEAETNTLANSLSRTWCSQIKKGRLLDELWSAHPLYVASASPHWTGTCRDALTKLLRRDTSTIGLTLLLFGVGFGTSHKFIDRICDGAIYRARVQSIIDNAGETDISPTTIAMLTKSVDRAFRM